MVEEVSGRADKKVAEPRVDIGTSWTNPNGRTWTVYERKPFGICLIRAGFCFGEMYDRDVRRLLAERAAEQAA